MRTEDLDSTSKQTANSFTPSGQSSPKPQPIPMAPLSMHRLRDWGACQHPKMKVLTIVPRVVAKLRRQQAAWRAARGVPTPLVAGAANRSAFFALIHDLNFW